MDYERRLSLLGIEKSVFLFGPRQTGKTSLLRSLFPGAPNYNLLDTELYFRLSARPALLREEILAMRPGPETRIIVDEIQKLPTLLDEIQILIDSAKVRFILTGSSARKLTRKGTNLLGGRARVRYLHPFVSAEIGESFSLDKVLRWGSLPPIWLSDDPGDDLNAYCGTYLQQEIQGEGIVRRIEGFARFLRVAALMNGRLLNYEAVASDAAVPARTIREYFSILADTLIGSILEPWQSGTRRKAVSTGKFWFFDIGVANALSGVRAVEPGTERYGNALEHLIFLEIRAWLDYRNDPRPLTFWRTREGHEVDFVVGDEIAVEVKASENPDRRDLNGLLKIKEESTFSHRVLVCRVPAPRLVDGIEVLPVTSFLRDLWADRWA